MKKWTEEEDLILKDKYGKISANEIGSILNRSKDSVHKRARRLKIIGTKYTKEITKHPLYQCWKGAKARCYVPNHSNKLNVEFCDEWKDNYEEFYRWALPLWKNGLRLRLKDKNKNYSPDNCYFTSHSEIVRENSNKEEVKKKTIETNLKRYGGHYTTTKEYLKKIIKTSREKYGTDHPQQSEEIKNRQKETVIEKYGSYKKLFEYTQPEREKTCLEKYGETHHMKTDEGRQKVREGLAKGGYCKLYEGKSPNQWVQKLDTVAVSALRKRINQFGFDEAIKMGKKETAPEKIVKEILKELDINYIHDKQMEKYRPDFLLSDYSLIIEVDGLYWHSDAINKNNSYHKNKQEYYLSSGYNSLFFRENEVNEKTEIVQSIIKYKTNNSTMLGARKCSIKTLSTKESNDFFNKNHLMGAGQGTTFALTNNKEIVCAIRFITKKDHIEISRFCNKINLSVQGGFSKLLKQLPNKKTISFVDKRYGSGKYLENLGFKKETDRLSFVWVKNDKTFHRMKYPNNTGYKNKCYKLWDCGQAKFVK